MYTVFLIFGGIYVGWIVLKAIREAVETEVAAFDQKRWVQYRIRSSGRMRRGGASDDATGKDR